MITNSTIYTQSTYATVGAYTVDATIAEISLDPSSRSTAFYCVKKEITGASLSLYVRIDGNLYLYERQLGGLSEISGDIFGEALMLFLTVLPNGDATTISISACQAQTY